MQTLHKPLADHIAATGKAFSYGAIGAFCGLSFLAGLALPMTDRASALVQFTGEESDILDYDLTATDCGFAAERLRPDRTSVVSGKSEAVRVDLGGRCIIHKNNQAPHPTPTTPPPSYTQPQLPPT